MRRCLHRPLEMPVLLLWAADDAVLRPPLTRGTERHALRLRVHMVPDCSHWLQQDRPEEANRLLEQWLREPA